MDAFPILIGDIGGTFSRFAIVEAPGADPIMLPRVETAAHPSVIAAIASVFGAARGARPRAALLAVAGPVDGPVMKLTNAAWLVDASAIADAFDLRAVDLVNDFVPVAAACADLAAGVGAVAIGPSLAPARGPRLAIGSGTGLGVGALIPDGERWLVQPSEAGHIDFGPMIAEEHALWQRMPRAEGRHTAEAFLCGNGLTRLARALATDAESYTTIDAYGVIRAAASGTDAVAATAVDTFLRLLGRFAGDMVLTFLARGGVYLAGGIPPRVSNALMSGGFRSAFEAKAPFGALLSQVPTVLVTAPEPAMLGLAALASRPERFVVTRQGIRR